MSEKNTEQKERAITRQLAEQVIPTGNEQPIINEELEKIRGCFKKEIINNAILLDVSSPELARWRKIHPATIQKPTSLLDKLKNKLPFLKTKNHSEADPKNTEAHQ